VATDYRAYPVLFVDDEEANRFVFQAVFGQEFDVVLAESGAEALRLVGERRPAVLIADQRMPDMTGVELIEAVRARSPEVVRVIVTAYADIRAAVDAINRGEVARYFSKPWNSVELRSYLRTTLEIFHLNRRTEELQLRLLRSERLATLGLAASSIAHDLRGPLTTLLGGLDALDLLLQDLVDDPPPAAEMAERVRSPLQILHECRTPADEIVRVLKAVRRSIRSERRSEQVALKGVVEGAARLLRGEIAARATLHLECDARAVVCGDAAELTQLVINLLANATSALPVGRQHENRIEVRVESRPEGALLAVRDTGCGIGAAQAERIFEPLFTTRSDGTGLGLAIVKRIVEDHRGAIDVASEPGRGATFTVRLPAPAT
jgi:signal transduction histidine kinase